MPRNDCSTLWLAATRRDRAQRSGRPPTSLRARPATAFEEGSHALLVFSAHYAHAILAAARSMSLEGFAWQAASSGWSSPPRKASGSHDALAAHASGKCPNPHDLLRDQGWHGRGIPDGHAAIRAWRRRGRRPQGRSHPSGRYAAVHDPPLCRRAAHRRGLGGQVPHPGLHLRHEPDPRHEGAGCQADRRRRV